LTFTHAAEKRNTEPDHFPNLLLFSDVNLALSVSVVKKSHEIEKLAKHVKELAKG
jgi:hypothetical protein